MRWYDGCGITQEEFEGVIAMIYGPFLRNDDLNDRLTSLTLSSNIAMDLCPQLVSSGEDLYVHLKNAQPPLLYTPPTTIVVATPPAPVSNPRAGIRPYDGVMLPWLSEEELEPRGNNAVALLSEEEDSQEVP